MVLLEWSPNEGCFRKFERLACALVRTRPPKEPDARRKSIWIENCKGLAGPFALTLLVTIPYVAENTSGPIIVASLLLAAVNAIFAVWCYNDFECNHGHCTGDIYTCIFSNIGEFPAFLVGWWRIQAYCAGFAASARTLSAIIDSVTGRHVETFMENTFGSFTPLGAPMDIMAVGVTFVPTVMCAVGMEESSFIRASLFLLASLTTMVIFGSALAASHLLNGTDPGTAAAQQTTSDRNLYSKIMSGAALASVGFLGIHKMCRPDNLTLTQHQHFQVIKKFSLTGCVIASTAFIFYFIESTILNKVQPTLTLWAGDPPLLWPLEGEWRLAVAALGIAALALATFEFLIPLCMYVTKVANDGLLYRNLRKQSTNLEDAKWNVITPLFFGALTALHALLIDTKVLLGILTSAQMSIHIIVSASMLVTRYRKRAPPSSGRKSYLSRTRRPRGANQGIQQTTQARRHMTVSFLKSGASKSKNPKELVNELESGAPGSSSGRASDKTFLMDDVAIAPIESRESTDFSIGSGVSGYESDSDPYPSAEDANETDVDAAVTEYQEKLRMDSLDGTVPMNPTPATARRVFLSTAALIPCCIALASSMNRPPRGHLIGTLLAVSSSLLTFLLLVVISRQPQRRDPNKHARHSLISSANSRNLESASMTTRSSGIRNFFKYSIVPWLPAFAIFLHSCLLLETLELAGTPFAFWLSTGLIIYFSYGVTKSIAAPPPVLPTERLKIRSQTEPDGNRQSTSAAGVQFGAGIANPTMTTGEPYAQIDTAIVA